MSGCGKCCGKCGGCGEMVLSQGEIEMLQTLWEIPFLPVARKADCVDPIYLENDGYTLEEASLIIQCLEKRGLISVDYYAPLKGFDYKNYEAYPLKGSLALTEKGQNIAEIIELNGYTI